MKSSTGPDGSSEFFSDYITNPSKRYQDWTSASLPEDFWSNYAAVYVDFRDNNKIIFRSKHVDVNNDLWITHVWPSETIRQEFLTAVNHTVFDASRSIPVENNNYDTDTAGAESVIADVLASGNYIVQICLPEFRVSGMSIGDPLKGDPLVIVD
tara:strand:- start:2411 stop:2872 length:462 start_codon:yes stop_codon:yes gene_type:complete